MTNSVLVNLPLPGDASSAMADFDAAVDEGDDDACCLCPHAVARQSIIYGRLPRMHSSSSSTAAAGWSWQTSLAPHRVTALVSNADGSILAAATDGGTVSLLRGCDGRVLATRQVAPAHCGAPTELFFLPRRRPASPDDDDEGSIPSPMDTLLIQVPGLRSNSDDEATVRQVVVVDQIHGAPLNGRPASAAEAARNLKIYALPTSTKAWSSVATLTAVPADVPDQLTLVTATHQGQVVLWDWDLAAATLVAHEGGALPLRLDDDDWCVDLRLGLQTQVYDPQHSYVVFGAHKAADSDRVNAADGASAVVWLDLASRQCVCHVRLPPTHALGALLPLDRATEGTLAVVLATKGSDAAAAPTTTAVTTTTQLEVYQVVVEDTMGFVVLSQPHVVFTIPLPGCLLHTVSLTPSLDATQEVYAFTYQYRPSTSPVVLTQVRPGRSSLATVAKIRQFLALGRFDEADALVARAGGADVLGDTPLAAFHPAQVAAARLRAVVMERSNNNDPQNDSATMATLAEGLEQLAVPAGTGHPTAVASFTQACVLLSNQWVGTRGADWQLQMVQLVVFCLVRVQEKLRTVPTPAAAARLHELKDTLQDRARALQFVVSIGDGNLVSPRLTQIRSTAELLATLVAEQKYSLVHSLWEQGHLSIDVVLEELVRAPTTNTTGSLVLLQDIVLPHLTIHHELLPILRAWACETADGMDDNGNGLAAAVSLLETIREGVHDLQLRLFSSFATYSPFVTGLQPRKVKRSPATSLSAKSARNELSTKATPLPLQPGMANRPPPTVLQLGGLKAGAAKAASRTIGKWSTNDEIDEECVERKLFAAKCLLRARALGLPKEAIPLRDFEDSTGLETCAEALALSLSRQSLSHEQRFTLVRERVKTFCEELGCDFDEALLRYASRLCKGAEVCGLSIEEASSIARCCWADEKKSEVTLSVVQAAILCGYSEDWLLDQAREAVLWASSNLSLQSEMEEAARLLLIDSIITKYCGRGARELFRVDNPKHAIRLMDFVIQRVKSADQINDVMGLCEAFTHLSKRDSFVAVMREGVMLGETSLCVSLLEKLYDNDSVFADKVLAGTLSFVVELLAELSPMFEVAAERTDASKTRAMQTTEVGYELLSVALQRGRKLSSDFDSDIHCFVKGDSLDDFQDQFLRLSELQERHEIFCSISDLFYPEKQIEATVFALSRASGAFLNDNFRVFLTEVKKAERACMLLTGRSPAERKSVWTAASFMVAESLVAELDAERLCQYLHGAGLFDGEENGIGCRGILRLAASLCSDVPMNDASQTSVEESYHISLAASIVREHALALCDFSTLASVIELDALFDSCHDILTMTDNGQGEKVIQFREMIGMKSRRYQEYDRNLESEAAKIDIHPPSLHPTWYHGDGLLLPPAKTSTILKWFCRSTMHLSGNSNRPSAELQRLLSEKGAGFSRLRILNTYVSGILTQASLRVEEGGEDEISVDIENSLLSLAERSVGGSGVGMTSGVIDSELSVAFLLALPVKLAFKIYTSTIPAALRTRQFHRVYALANIGKSLCTRGISAIEEEFRPIAWTRQQKFRDQCTNLALQASWWIRLSKQGISFDANQFEKSADNSQESKHYVSSLILPSIGSFSNSVTPNFALQVVSAFASDFNIDVSEVLESQLEFMLAPIDSGNGQASDLRSDLGICKTVASQCLRRLQPRGRATVLRRCARKFETGDDACTDYERYAVVLSLYREGLIAILDKTDVGDVVDPAPFEVELELVDRRKDALEILSSFFSGSHTNLRPNFSAFFTPLSMNFGETPVIDNSNISVLGCSQDTHDPLQPLRSVMLSRNNASAAAALAPLYLSLGLPLGFVRARFLMARFELSVDNETSMPSLETDVLPVLEKLRNPRDKALLSEWIASRYCSQDEDRLRCYELALQAAMKASSEIEFRRRNTSGLADLEAESLEAVRRITIAKGALSDKLRVAAILRSCTVHHGGRLQLLVDEMVSELHQQEAAAPEFLLDFLLQRASVLVAEVSLDDAESLSTSQFRQMVALVNRVCVALSEQHSHVDPHRHARRLASRWLFRGNTDSAEQVDDAGSLQPRAPSSNLASIQDTDENDTMDFVLDLDGLRQSDVNTNSKLIGNSNDGSNHFQTSEEEPSALRQTSAREKSEKDAQFAALRIAFVLASTIERGKGVDENLSPQPKKSAKPSSGRKLFGMLSKVESKKESRNADVAAELGRHLLQVVFAKKMFKHDAFNDSMHSQSVDSEIYDTKTITYAMRHRALRAAAVLCPQEILEDICSSEGYLRLDLETKDVSLQQCSFGVFVAREIEEMGLQLPHSDLPQLSSMNFPTYARTLWRHNRDGTAGRGRLLLLLTEMALKDNIVDGEFLGTLFKEMGRIQLPRTRLFALERIAASRHREACKKSPLLWQALESTANLILSETFSWVSGGVKDEELTQATSATIHQLGRLMIRLCGVEQGPKLDHFVKVASQLSSKVVAGGELHSCLGRVLEEIERSVARKSFS